MKLVLHHSCRLSEQIRAKEEEAEAEATNEDNGSNAAEGQGIQSLAQIRLTQKTKASIRIHYHSTTRGDSQIAM